MIDISVSYVLLSPRNAHIERFERLLINQKKKDMPTIYRTQEIKMINTSGTNQETLL